MVEEDKGIYKIMTAKQQKMMKIKSIIILMRNAVIVAIRFYIIKKEHIHSDGCSTSKELIQFFNKIMTRLAPMKNMISHL